MASELPLNQAQENDIVNRGLSKVPYPHLTGLRLSSDIRINGLTLNTIDEYDVLWVCTDIDGWWNLASSEIPDIARGLDDGSYDVRGRRSARILTLTGSIIPQRPEDAPAARQRFMEAINLTYTGGWLYVDEEPTKAAYVRLSGQPQIANVNRRGRIDFSVQLKAADPIKYSWNDAEPTTGYTYSTITSSTPIVNDGNTPVAGLFTLFGPMTAPVYIVNNGPDGSTQTLKIVKDLRSSAYSANVSNSELSSGIATLTVPGHNFYVGDVINVANVSSNYNATDAVITEVSASTVNYAKTVANIVSITHTSNTATITTATNHGLTNGTAIYIGGSSNPFLDGAGVVANTANTTFTITKTISNQTTGYGGAVSRQLSSASATGTVTLKNTDTVQIDTYNGTVLYRGLSDSSRSTLAVNVDWIKLLPGTNNLTFSKQGGSSNTCFVQYRSGWIG
jgi:hypothetical protein